MCDLRLPNSQDHYFGVAQCDALELLTLATSVGLSITIVKPSTSRRGTVREGHRIKRNVNQE